MYPKSNNLCIKALIFLFLIIAYISENPSHAIIASFQDNLVENDVKIEIKARSSDRKISEIIIEPARDEFIYENIPSNFYIPKGVCAYKISAKDSTGSLIHNTKFKNKFTLQIRYPKYISPEEAVNLRIFMLSSRKTWIPLSSQVDTFKRFIKTENANQLGIYSLFAPLSYNLEVIAYPNPVQFGQFGGINKTLKFMNVPLGSVIEIFTITGEKIKEINEINSYEVEWDGTRDNGNLLTSGLYLYRVRTSSGEAYGKIAVIR